MIQIRNNCFETNSSSSHSLVIMNDSKWDDEVYHYDGDEDDDPWVKEGVWDLSEEDLYFGRTPFRILSTFPEKVAYAYASLYDGADEVTEIVKKYIPGLKEVKLPKILGTDYYQLEGWLKKNNITLEEFITHDKYIVICDGDEYCIWENLKESGLIDTLMFGEEE